MNNRVCRPTDYLGVRYRSKSEACMAKYLSDAGFIVQYEPYWLRVDTWVPDFGMWGFCSLTPGMARPVLTVIEYKPRSVSEAYRDELQSRFETLGTRLVALPAVRLELWCGSFWENEGRTIDVWDRHEKEWWNEEDGWHDSEWGCVDEVRNYRFDLVPSEAQ